MHRGDRAHSGAGGGASEVARLLKPGGRAIIIDKNPVGVGHHRFYLNWLYKAMMERRQVVLPEGVGGVINVFGMFCCAHNVSFFLSIANRLRGWVRPEPAIAACQAVVIFVLATHRSFHDSASVLKLTVTLAGFSLLGVFMVSVLGLLMPSIVKTR
jgi:hypothetical protein